jgi:excisionase family DNA binding protein
LIETAIGNGALHADAIREVTAITLDIATKRDIADLKQVITDLKACLERRGRESASERGGTSDSPYLLIDECAAYIGRTVLAVRGLVARRGIPHSRVGGRVQFDREAIDRWMKKNGRRSNLP